MTVRERVLALKLLEKQKKQAKHAEKLNIEIKIKKKVISNE